MQQSFIPYAHSGNQTQNLGIKPKSARALLLGTIFLASPNYGTFFPNYCEWPPQGLGIFWIILYKMGTAVCLSYWTFPHNPIISTMMKFQLVEIETYFPMRFFLCIEIEMLSIIYLKIWKKYKQKNLFCFELSSKPNVDIDGITVSMWGKHEFETIFTSNDVMNIQGGIGKRFGYR